MAETREKYQDTPTSVRMSTTDIPAYNLNDNKKVYVGQGTKDLPSGYGWDLPSDYKAPSVITSNTAKEDTTKNVDNLNKMGDQMSQTPEKPPVKDDITSQVDKYMAESPEAKAINDANTAIETQTNNYLSQLDTIQARMDERQQGIIEGIKANYERRKEEMRTFNSNMLSGKTIRGVRSGRQRYARDLNADILSKEEKAGIDRLGVLDDMMNAEIMKAEQDLDANELAMLDKRMTTLTNLYNQKRQTALDLATISSNYEKTLIDRMRYEMDMTKFEQEQMKNVANNLATGLIGIDNTGNLIEPTPEDITRYAEQYGIDEVTLLGSVNNRIDEMKEMSMEQKKYNLETMKLQQEIASYGMSKEQQEYEYARDVYGYTGSIFDYIQDKEVSSMSPYELLKQQIELQKLQADLTASGDFEKIQIDGVDWFKYENGDLVKASDVVGDKTNILKAESELAQVELIRSLYNHQGMKQAVGANPLSRGAKQVFVPGSGVSPLEVAMGSAKRKEFLGFVQQLVDDVTLKKLIEVKGQGATFGALSDSERAVIERAATPINQWKITDKNGVVVGYDIDEKSFKQELKRLEELSTEAAKKSSGINYLDYDELVKDIPEEQLREQWNETPGETIEEKRNNLLQYYNQQTSFNKVGSDTNTATLSKAVSYNDGTKGGQCGRFVNNLTGLGLGDSYQSKMAKMDPTIKTPAPGMVFVMPYKQYGHTGIILSVKNGIATVKDSNYSLDEKIKTHQIPVSKMTGFAMA